jgi:hypothetical protein
VESLSNLKISAGAAIITVAVHGSCANINNIHVSGSNATLKLYSVATIHPVNLQGGAALYVDDEASNDTMVRSASCPDSNEEPTTEGEEEPTTGGDDEPATGDDEEPTTGADVQTTAGGPDSQPPATPASPVAVQFFLETDFSAIDEPALLAGVEEMFYEQVPIPAGHHLATAFSPGSVQVDSTLLLQSDADAFYVALAEGRLTVNGMPALAANPVGSDSSSGGASADGTEDGGANAGLVAAILGAVVGVALVTLVVIIILKRRKSERSHAHTLPKVSEIISEEGGSAPVEGSIYEDATIVTSPRARAMPRGYLSPRPQSVDYDMPFYDDVGERAPGLDSGNYDNNSRADH